MLFSQLELVTRFCDSCEDYGWLDTRSFRSKGLVLSACVPTQSREFTSVLVAEAVISRVLKRVGTPEAGN